MSKYETLLKVLDQLRLEAPRNYKRYHPGPSDAEKLENARGRSFIHLYLKVKFGLLTFEERERLITDDGEDGGIDGYFIDKTNRVVYIIQSKFRNTEKNFEEKEISVDEIVKIEVDRILKGDPIGENGKPYNSKITKFQTALEDREYKSQYQYKLIILANCNAKKLLEKLYADYTVEVFNFEKTYQELVFPIISGTYFQASDLNISISLENTNAGHPRVSYTAKVGEIEADVTLIFAPVSEIGRLMSHYRNSILLFNPRSYLGLSRNSVNREIEETITKSSTNEFALFNNGITFVADEAGYSDKTGKKGTAHLDLKNPQIINGGQTAYTLCKIFDDINAGKQAPSVFEGKEVLLKIISIDPAVVNKAKRTDLIERISRATNLQTPVDEADRRANEPLQLQLQHLFFQEYGLFYERKAGEFFDGIKAKYLSKDSIVDREILLRVALATEFQVSETRGRIGRYFSADSFGSDLLKQEKIAQYAFGYECHRVLSEYVTKSKKAGTPYYDENYGAALRYGRLAVVCVAVNRFALDPSQAPNEVADKLLAIWVDFENWCAKQSSNKKYLNASNAIDFVLYYKGDTVNADLKNYFFKKSNEISIGTMSDLAIQYM